MRIMFDNSIYDFLLRAINEKNSCCLYETKQPVHGNVHEHALLQLQLRLGVQAPQWLQCCQWQTLHSTVSRASIILSHEKH